ncbi:MAG: hypothetical protein IKC14_09355, partial [Kiritimatiellae bacterium]|nr:hypothetical protein [Kiritimatiellia bacterium]
GGGWGRGIYLTNGTFRVTGGTVLAAKGAGAYSDFVTASGNTIDVTRGKSIVIDGACSVRPKNAVVANANPCPGPVNSNDVRLVFSVIDGLGPGDIVHLSDDIWTQYGNADLLADDGGAICLWGESTNVERNVEIQSPNIPGGKMPFTLSAASNTITHVSDDYEAPESRRVNGVDCYRVSVVALPARKRLPVEGIDAAYSRGTTVSDATGMTYLYLPDGSYDFTVGGYAYHAEVNGGVATATFTVGILVDGVDIGACSGDGWSYNGTTEILSLNAAKEYVVSGTNAERQVSVCAATRGVKIRADRLELAPAGRGAFYAADGVPSFEYAGGTLGTGSIPSQMVVSGGSIDAALSNPVAVTSSGVLTNAYCVTIDGLPRFAKVEIANIDGLENYDTQGIYANEYGEVYLYLPDGDYWFGVSDGATTSEKIAIVDGAEAVALNYEPTGVCINGRDAARLRGDGWLNEDGLVQLLAATDYVLSGTNEGAAVTFQAQTSRTTLVFDNLVMTNAAMEVSPVSVGSGQKATFTVELRGTNILHGVSSDAWCGVEMLQMTELNFTGDGYLEATGQGPGIGMGRGEVADMSSVVIHSGTIVATGGSSAA